MTKLRLASKCNVDSIVDGPGLRTVIWTQGCPHHCKNCHNPQTHDVDGGFEMEIEELIAFIDQLHLQSGVTLSGGEPFLQAKTLLPVVRYIKEKKMNIWAYSGYTYDELIKDSDKLELLKYVDVLVDGRFVDELKDYRLRFKGSKNQRIIDVQASLKEGSVILSHYDDENQKID